LNKVVIIDAESVETTMAFIRTVLYCTLLCYLFPLHDTLPSLPSLNDVNILIVNGQLADSSEGRHMVSLINNDEVQYCGGNLIDPETVLTAAHCAPLEHIWVRYGTHDNSKEVFTDIYVQEAIVHPDFQHDNASDIAILKLEHPVVQNSQHVNFIRLEEDADFLPGSIAETYGWGYVDEDESSSNHLMKTTMKILSYEECEDEYDEKEFICVISLSSDTCGGDSGSGLVLNNRLIGINSNGEEKCQPNQHGAFTSVPYFYDWIQENRLLLSMK